MNPRRATTAVLCLACVIAAGDTLRGTVWPRAGGGTLVLAELHAGAAWLGQDIGVVDRWALDHGQVLPALATVGAAHAAEPADATAMARGVAEAGFWGDYRSYLADPDGHVWSGQQQ